MIIEKKKLKDLKPNPINPRKSSVTQDENLRKSLEKFGVVEPIVFNKQSGYIVGGHFRVRELIKMGVKEVECVIVDLNEADEKELNIRLNANTGEFDWEIIQSEWSDEPLSDWGLELPKFETEINEKEKTTTTNWYLNIEFNTENECQEWYEKLINEGLTCKIIQ